jgi:uncharacterized damage-inducible protein DinB
VFLLLLVAKRKAYDGRVRFREALKLRRKINAQELAGELQAVREVFAYNTFVRKRYLAFFAKLSKETLTKDREASYPSILDIFVHVLYDRSSWFYTYRTGKQDGRVVPETEIRSLADVRSLETKVDRYIANFMRKLSPEDVNKPFRFTVIAGPEEGQLITWSLKGMLWHLVEEELQHRGEINALLWQEDIDPPVTSWWRWEKATTNKKTRKARE